MTTERRNELADQLLRDGLSPKRDCHGMERIADLLRAGEQLIDTQIEVIYHVTDAWLGELESLYSEQEVA